MSWCWRKSRSSAASAPPTGIDRIAASARGPSTLLPAAMLYPAAIGHRYRAHRPHCGAQPQWAPPVLRAPISVHPLHQARTQCHVIRPEPGEDDRRRQPAVREAARATVDRASSEAFTADEQRFSGLDEGRWASKRELDQLAQQRTSISQVKRKTGLYKNEADRALALRAIHSVVLSLDEKRDRSTSSTGAGERWCSYPGSTPVACP